MCIEDNLHYLIFISLDPRVVALLPVPSIWYLQLAC